MPAAPTAPARIGRQAFAPLVGQQLHCVGENGDRFLVTLLEVRGVDADQRLEQFSLLFARRGDGGPGSAGELVQLHHPDLGLLLLRLEPSSTREMTWFSDFSLLA